MKKLLLFLALSSVTYLTSCAQDADAIARRYAKRGIEKLFALAYARGEVPKKEAGISVTVLDAFLKANTRLEIEVQVQWTGGVFSYQYNLRGYLYTDLDGCNTKWSPKEWNGYAMAATKTTKQDLGCIDEAED